MESTGGVLENPYNTGPGPDAFISSTYYKPTKITTHHSKKYYKKKEYKKGQITFIDCTKMGLGCRRREQLGPRFKFTDP